MTETGESVQGPLSSSVSEEELQRVEALRRGEEAAFVQLVDRYQSSLLGLAYLYLRDRATAQEVVQETWVAVLQGIDRFEGRSSLRTWISQILLNRARTCARREGRMVPFSQLVSREVDTAELAVDPDRFQGPDEELPGHWSSSPPQSWGEDAEQRLLSKETLEQIQSAIDILPQAQRMVITLRDVQGWSSEEICNVLDISETNQRVLLHRRAIQSAKSGGKILYGSVINGAVNLEHELQ